MPRYVNINKFSEKGRCGETYKSYNKDYMYFVYSSDDVDNELPDLMLVES